MGSRTGDKKQAKASRRGEKEVSVEGRKEKLLHMKLTG